MSNWPNVRMILAHYDGAQVRSTVVQVSGTEEHLAALRDALDSGQPLTLHMDHLRFHNGRHYAPVAEFGASKKEDAGT